MGCVKSVTDLKVTLRYMLITIITFALLTAPLSHHFDDVIGGVGMAAIAIRSRNSTKLNVLLYSGFRYQKNKTTNTAVYWRCWLKSCRASMKTTLFNTG